MQVYGNPPYQSTGFVSFDDIPFSMLNIGGSERNYVEWAADPIIVERHVPRSDRTYRQNMGSPLAKMTAEVEFFNLEDMRAFEIAHHAQRRGRLTLLAGFTTLRGVPSTIHMDYEHFDWVVIDRITDRVIPLDNRPYCKATFAAAFDPLTMRVVP